MKLSCIGEITVEAGYIRAISMQARRRERGRKSETNVNLCTNDTQHFFFFLAFLRTVAFFVFVLSHFLCVWVCDMTKQIEQMLVIFVNLFLRLPERRYDSALGTCIVYNNSVYFHLCRKSFTFSMRAQKKRKDERDTEEKRKMYEKIHLIFQGKIIC